MTRPLRIGHLYPEAMNLYGDIGNVRALQRRAAWRGVELEVVAVGQGPVAEPDCDLVLFGGGQDRDQSLVYQDLVTHKAAWLRGLLDGGAAMLAVCGGYQLLGHSYTDADGRRLDGLGFLDLTSEAGDNRWIGNVLVESDESLGLEPRRLVGFENHGGRTFLGSGLRPLGRVIVGGGNNGGDGGEGVLAGRIVGTYLHGSLLPKNPALGDWLLAAALAHRDGGEVAALAPLDDTVELTAHARAVDIALAERGRGPVSRRT